MVKRTEGNEKMARLPLITQRRDIDVKVIYGQSIFEFYQQIQNLLQREAPELSNFFAEPIINVILALR